MSVFDSLPSLFEPKTKNTIKPTDMVEIESSTPATTSSSEQPHHHHHHNDEVDASTATATAAATSLTSPPQPVLLLHQQPTATTTNANNVNASTNVVIAAAAVDRDILCPICMQILKDAFLTVCGHSFCYMCIVTHLRNTNDCPCCQNRLTLNLLFPNFALNQLVKKTFARQIPPNESPFQQLRRALNQGCEVSVKELDTLLSLLSEKKRKMEQEEAETNMHILLDFLHTLRKQKLQELHEIHTDLQYIKEDINSVEKQRKMLYQATQHYSAKLKTPVVDNNPNGRPPLSIENHSNEFISSPRNLQAWIDSNDVHNSKAHLKSQTNSSQRRHSYSGSDSQPMIQSGSTLARKRQVHAQFSELQECYLQKRRHWAREQNKKEVKGTDAMPREGYHAGLEDFQTVLNTFTQYSRLRVIAELRHADLFHSANIVSSIEFDRDDQLFATAGVSRSIKVFEFSSIVNEPTEVHCPIVEMSTLSKLSCLSWSKYTKSYIASSDYEGIVTVWDVNTRQSVMEYEEHEKRAWSVDFSRTDPSMLVSGSDDCKVKVWSTKQERSVLNIDMKANICSVKYNPGSSFHVAVGSADHHIHYYDLRKINQPLHVFSGHKKAVSYVKFLSNTELASASTDSTLRLWDVKESLPVRTFRGHTNEKNFVGLTVNKEFVACGSETNEVYVYNKAVSKPMAWHKFCAPNTQENEEAGSYFISAVCWKSDSHTVLTANSEGTIKVLVLAA